MVKQGTTVWKMLLLTVIFLGQVLPALAQRLQERRTAGGIGFMEFLPPDYATSGKRHPLMIFLHGIGERGNGTTDLRRVVMWGTPIQMAESGNNMTFTVNGQQFSYIVLAPQLLSQYGNWPASYIDQVVEHAKANYRIDESRIYITGLSLGGGGTWDYAAAYPQKVAAIVPICGASGANSTKINALATNNIPVWATHGTSDGVVGVNTTLNWVNGLNNHPTPPTPRPRLTLYQGEGHFVWNKTYSLDPVTVDPTAPDVHIYEWMLRYTKNGVIANAGPDLTLNAPVTSVQLRGSALAQGTQIASIQWTQISGSPAITIQQGNTATPTLVNVPIGTYTFRITVAGTNGKTATDDVVVKVQRLNLLPVSNPGVNQSVTLPLAQVVFDGRQSYDPDGTISSFRWDQVGIGSNAEAVLINFTGNSQQAAPWNNTSPATTSGAVIGNLRTQGGQTSPINITLQSNWGGFNEFGATANNAGALPDNVMRSAFWFETGTHPLQVRGLRAGTTYRFGFFASRTGAGDRNTRYTIGGQSVTLNASDNTSQIVWLNNVQAGSTGEVQIVVEKLATSVYGYLGAIIIEPVPQIQNTNTSVLTVNNLIPGTFRYRLTVTDNDGAQNAKEVQLTVTGTGAITNRPPVVGAGNAQAITLPTSSVTLTGTASDPDGTIASVRWTQVSGPNTGIIATPAALQTTASGLVQGSYIFRITATDNSGASASADVSITVNPANRVPVVSAGNAQSVTLLSGGVTLSGTASDPDGTIASVRWTQVSGPNTATITTPTNLQTTVSGLVQGNYVFRLTATDNRGASAFADVAVAVNAVTNRVPVASAGNAQTITLPTNSVTLAGTASDPDGTIASVRWTQVSGPNTATIAAPAALQTAASGLVQGNYIFRITATDNAGASAFADVAVTVNAAVNLPPVANPGANQTITLPASQVVLDGRQSTDPDGTISSFRWEQVGIGSNAEAVLVNFTGISKQAAPWNNSVATYNAGTIINNLRTHGGQTSPISVTLQTNWGGYNEFGNTANNAGAVPDNVMKSAFWFETGVHPLLIKGLKAGTTYRFGFFASRAGTGDRNTRYTIGNQSVTLNASDNTSQIVWLNNVQANSTGELQVVVEKLATAAFGYLGALIIEPVPQMLNANTSVLTINNLTPGTFRYRLTVTDNRGASNAKEVGITVNPPANQQPVVSAAEEVVITQATSVTLSGTASDPDNDLSSVQWTQITGPTGAVIDNTNSLQVRVSGLADGEYVFRLTATDKQGLSATSTVIVRVNRAVANAATDASTGTNEKQYIQKVLSPNNDGIGDTWIVDRPGELAVTIFDRMGQVVYQTEDYRHDWSGISKDGVPLPPSTYFYQIKVKQSAELITGAINIIK